MKLKAGIGLGVAAVIPIAALVIYARQPAAAPEPRPRPVPPPIEAPTISPDAAEEAWIRGNAAMEREAFDEALLAFEEALGHDPSYLLALVGRGNVRLALQEYDSALADFSAALRQDPGSADAYLSRATTNWLLGRLFEAERDYRRLAEMFPDNSFYADRLAAVLHEAGKSDEVERLYRAAFERNPSNDWALGLWLQAVREQGVDAVVERGNALHQLGIDRPALRQALGAAYLERRDYPAAIHWLEPLASAEPSRVHPDALHHLATAYAHSGNIPACETAMRDYAMRLGRPSQYSPTACAGGAPS